MPSVPGKSKWKERIAQVLQDRGLMNERQIMVAIEHDSQHTRGVLRNMLKAGIVKREQRGLNNSYWYSLAVSPQDISSTRIPDFSKLRQRTTAIKNLFLNAGVSNPRLSEEEIMRSFGLHPRGVREALRELQNSNWLLQKDGRFMCTEVTEEERAVCQSIVKLQSLTNAHDLSEASTESESACNSPSQVGSGAFFGARDDSKRLDELVGVAVAQSPFL
mmetsp:Transcript_16092/g.40528  ORF Transcript_16092/g.40528 Transcript_16092/m.40528 type:complete len:218 (-) Transcript_16092:53-706(-)|eukprot:CAMPEP_0173437042 /NCGR_PEP_ID=MMETSP1357-20121228/17817_1 /TAXON_ID=77926 /ORGANISM="Hemiselmis rufescens, Strain PCC563" /LENGTH=217 /DNA_ID=CAMNT_0014402203 /DNA_START=92 /DNA_END=745 /DNA_ORIENTATION=+